MANLSDFIGGGGGGFTSMQVFTTSGTWTKPDGITKILVRGVGGGGGGGGSRSGYNEQSGGGAAGGYFEKLIDVTAVSSVSVTIGSGGGSAANTAGTAGGDTIFAGYATGFGGAGGKIGYSGTSVGGNATGGDVNVKGQDGSLGANPDNTNGGQGGSSLLGMGGPMRNRSLSNDGIAGTGYGAGGSGGSGGGGGQAGGTGSGGIIMVMEYA
jgi:hypothetical protein